jgi:hypothetical protein
MDYQLILQFRGDSARQLAELKSLEDDLTETLGSSEAFDGIDASERGTNLFFYTDDPKRTLEHIRPFLKGTESAAGFSAAYRTVSREQFRNLWPPDSTLPFSLR